MISKLPPWLDRNREWVGMDVDIGDGDSLLDSEGEGDIGEQEDGKVKKYEPRPRRGHRYRETFRG